MNWYDIAKDVEEANTRTRTKEMLENSSLQPQVVAARKERTTQAAFDVQMQDEGMRTNLARSVIQRLYSDFRQDPGLFSKLTGVFDKDAAEIIKKYGGPDMVMTMFGDAAEQAQYAGMVAAMKQGNVSPTRGILNPTLTNEITPIIRRAESFKSISPKVAKGTGTFNDFLRAAENPFGGEEGLVETAAQARSNMFPSELTSPTQDNSIPILSGILEAVRGIWSEAQKDKPPTVVAYPSPVSTTTISPRAPTPIMKGQ